MNMAKGPVHAYLVFEHDEEHVLVGGGVSNHSEAGDSGAENSTCITEPVNHH